MNIGLSFKLCLADNICKQFGPRSDPDLDLNCLTL